MASVLVASVLVASLVSATANAQDAMELERLGELVAAAKAAQPPESAYAPLLAIDEFDQHLPPDRLEAALRDLAEAPLLPMVRSYARWRLADHLTRTGDQVEAERMIAAEGFLTRWHIIGPFANDGMAGLTTAYAPEERIAIDEPADGIFPRLRWRTFASQGRAGYVRLSSVVSPTHDAVVYMATIVTTPAATDAVLWLTVDGAFRAWVGTTLVGEQTEDLGGPIDREGFAVKLAAGPNLLVIKVANDEGFAGLYARLTSKQLTPLAFSHGEIAPASALALSQSSDQVQAVPAVYEAIVAHAMALPQGQPSWELARAWAAYTLHRVMPNDVSRPGDSLMLETIMGGVESVQTAILANYVLEDAWRQRAVTKDALRTFPNDPWLITARIEQLLDGAPLDRNHELNGLLARLEEQQPHSVIGPLLHERGHALDGLSEAAYTMIVEAATRFPTTPSLLDAAQEQARELDRLDEQAAWLRRLIDVQRDIDVFRDDLAGVLVKQGDAEAAVTVLADGLALRPDAYMLMVHQAEILDATGDAERAERMLDEVLAATPTNATLFELVGNWRVERGDLSAALDAYRTSLGFEAQNEGLRQLVRYLDPDNAPFEEPYVVDDIARFTSSDEQPDDYITLVDQEIVLLHPNGLTSTYMQKAYQIITDEGVSALRRIPVYYTPGDEVLEFDLVRVTKPDGSTREIFDRREYSVADESVRMYYDRRQVTLEPPDLDVGDTLEVRYRRSQVAQTSYFDSHFGDVWFMQDTVPVRFARYVLISPVDVQLHFRLPEGDKVAVEQVERDGQRVTTIEAHDVPKIDAERQMPGFAEVADYVIVSTFADWGGVARWYYNLAKDQWIVDSEIREVVRQLVDGVEDRREKVGRIHNYVVKNTRYVALEFGVHGYKPYRTTVCFRRRFGDCKDKASLIKVMLEEAGIPADIVLVRTRRNGAIATDPANLSIFDHAIAYVPEFDLFLDGTAEFSGTSELPAMDQGITVLVVKEHGDYALVTTPIFPAADNRVESTYAITLATDGANVRASSTLTGQFAPMYRQRYESQETRRDKFEDELSRDFSSAAVSLLEFDSLEDLEQPVAFRFEAQTGALLQPSNGGFLLYPHGHPTQLARRLAPSPERKHALVLSFPFELVSTITFTLPAGYQLAQLPAPTALRSRFGALESSVEASGTTLVVRSRFVLDTYQVSAEDYDDFLAFALEADRVLNTPMLLTPN